MPAPTYLDEVLARSAHRLEGHLLAAWLSGSLAGRDFGIRRSDIDIVLVTTGADSHSARASLVAALRHGTLPCPARALDLVVFREDEVREPKRTPTHLCSLTTGARTDDRVSWGGSDGRAILDLGLVKARGRPLSGPEPRDVVGEIPVEWVVEELRAAIDRSASRLYHPVSDPLGIDAVLSTCRALCYLDEGRWAGKRESGRWYLHKEDVPVVRNAMRLHDSNLATPLDEAAVRAFLEHGTDRFEAALDGSREAS